MYKSWLEPTLYSLAIVVVYIAFDFFMIRLIFVC